MDATPRHATSGASFILRSRLAVLICFALYINCLVVILRFRHQGTGEQGHSTLTTHPKLHVATTYQILLQYPFPKLLHLTVVLNLQLRVQLVVLLGSHHPEPSRQRCNPSKCKTHKRRHHARTARSVTSASFHISPKRRARSWGLSVGCAVRSSSRWAWQNNMSGAERDTGTTPESRSQAAPRRRTHAAI